MLRLILLTCCLSLTALVGCDDEGSEEVSFQVAPNDEFSIPGLGLNDRVYVSVRHVGYTREEDADDGPPSIGQLRVYDDENSLADEPLMYEGDTLRFTYDDATFALTVEGFEFEGDDFRRAKADLLVERL